MTTFQKANAGLLVRGGAGAWMTPPKWSGRAGMAQLISEVDWLGNPTAPYRDQVQYADGCTSYWRFASESQFPDEQGIGTGTINGGTRVNPGLLPYNPDPALTFNGSSQYANVVGPYNQAGSWSVMGGLRFASLPGALKPIFAKDAYKLEIDSGGHLVFTVINHVSGGSTMTQVTSHTVLTANTIYHVACTHVSGVGINLYINGVLDNTAAHTIGAELWGLPLLFGARHSGTSPSFGTVGTSTIGGSTAYTITAPASIASGDLLVAYLFGAPGAGQALVTAVPAGWIRLDSSINVLGTGEFNELYYKIAGAGDVGAGSYTWTTNINVFGSGSITRFTGVDTTSPFANPPYALVSNVTNHSGGTNVPLCDDTLAVAYIGASSGAFSSSIGTERYDFSGQGNYAMYTLAVGAAATTEFVISGAGPANDIVRTLFLKGPDAQDFNAVTLDEWSFHTIALSADGVRGYYEARLSGVARWEELLHNNLPDVRTLQFQYGRQYELNRMEGGGGSAPIKNQTRDYDPANTNSAHYPYVKPNRKIRFRAYYSGRYYPLFQGLVERWPSSWDQPSYDEMKVTLADGFRQLQRAGVSGQLSAAQSGAQINELLRRALWSQSNRAIDPGFYTMAADTSPGIAEAKGLIEDIADSELGIFFIDHTQPGSPATHHDSRHRWTVSRSSVAQATFADDGSGIYFQQLDPSDDDDNMANEWQVTSANGTLGSAVDPVSRVENYPVTKTRSTRLDNPLDAEAQARALLLDTARPMLRFDKLVVRMGGNTAAIVWQTCLSLAISDLVLVVKSPVPSAGGSTITRYCFIEGIGWDIQPNYWEVSYQLSPQGTLPFIDAALLLEPVSYWRFDTTT